MLKKTISFCFAMLTVTVLAASLINCPDCSKPVSSRAVFCPSCGCPGDAIAEAAKKMMQKNSKTPDGLLKVVTGERTGFALPVEMTDGLFAVAPLEFLLTADSLSLSLTSTNVPVAYFMPEVAVNAPLVRFPITETNLTYWCAAPLESQGEISLNYSTVNGITFSHEATALSVASFSASTNIVSVYTSATGSRFAQRLDPTQKWQRIQPKTFREHGRIFEKMMKGETATPPATWSHPIFEALLKREQTKEQ
jgi:hypothetical protein